MLAMLSRYRYSIPNKQANEVTAMVEILKNPILCGMVVSVSLPIVLLVVSEIDDLIFNKRLANKSKTN